MKALKRFITSITQTTWVILGALLVTILLDGHYTGEAAEEIGTVRFLLFIAIIWTYVHGLKEAARHKIFHAEFMRRIKEEERNK